MDFKDKLKNARTARGISQIELAEQTGISRRSIQNYEMGTKLPKQRETYGKLAQALGIDAAVLMDETIDFVLRANEQYGNIAMKQALDLVEDVRALWAGGEMEEDDMDEIMRALQEAYWDAKKNNRKYAGKRSDE